MSPETTQQATARRHDELWGYVIWTICVAIVLVPEIAAASTGSRSVPWPTISAMTGHLEYSASWVSLIVVALVVSAAFGVFSYHSHQPGMSPGHPSRRVFGRTARGRLTHVQRREAATTSTVEPEDGTGDPDLATTPTPTAEVVWALVAVAVTAVIAFGTWFTSAHDGGDKFVTAYVLYGLIAVFVVIFPNVISFFFRRDVPFPTFFRTLRYLEVRCHPAVLLVAIGLVILVLHLALYP